MSARRRWTRIVLAVVVVLVGLWLALFMDWLAPVPEGEGPLGSGLKPLPGEELPVAPPAEPSAEDPSLEPR